MTQPSLGPAVKICGLTRLEDVVAAKELGVWAIGMVFAPSPRRLEPSAARRLLEAAGLRHGRHEESGQPLVVGVFTDAKVDEIVNVVQEVELDAVQLHGLTGPSAAEVSEALAGSEREVLVIRALPVEAGLRDAAELREAVAREAVGADIVLLDTRVAAPADGGTGTAGGFGGTGAAFCWDLACEVAGEAAGARLMVAGGIDPENVQEALSRSGAWGVDVSSGVESAPGIKDMELMGRLVAEVKEGRAK